MLDADLFARSAPGLRDVRLVQDGRELAYAIDISQDEPGAAGAGGSTVDRALYEVALVLRAYPSEWAGVAGNGQQWSRPDHPPGWFYGMGSLPAHVPVERIRLDSAVAGTEFLRVSAAEANRLRDAETLDTTLTPEHPAAAFTVGANLQQDADIRLNVNGDMKTIGSFVLEMRRREICYQPLTGSPVSLLFGNVSASPVHYAYGMHYQPKATPLLSSMGPIHANSAFHQASTPRAAWSERVRLMVAIAGCALALLLTVGSLMRRRRLPQPR